jgi:hypothetical protein
MAHFAQLDENNSVIEVIVVNNNVVNNLPFPESEPLGVEFCKSLYGADTVWKQTSYNASFREYYACVTSLYLPVEDAFTPVKPYPSWHWDYEKNCWEAPVPMPQDGKAYYWDETTQSWVEVPQS